MNDEDRLIIWMFWNAMRFGVGISAGLRSDQLTENEILKSIGWGDPRYGEDGWLLRFARGITARQTIYAGFFNTNHF